MGTCCGGFLCMGLICYCQTRMRLLEAGVKGAGGFLELRARGHLEQQGPAKGEHSKAHAGDMPAMPFPAGRGAGT